MIEPERTCGLLTREHAVPLTGVSVAVRVVGGTLDVTVLQRYRNCETKPLETVYVFPLEEAAAVCGFAATVGGRRIVGHVEEREKAFATYDDAMMRGDGAFLLDQERPNVFTASVGNLKPNEEVEVELRYVAQATREGDAWRVAIPTTVSPRYVPASGPEVGEPDGERVNPEHRAHVPYTLSLSVEIAGHALRSVESPSHPIRTGFDAETVRVELATEGVPLDRDFVLLLAPAEPRKPEAVVARELDGTRVAMLTFLPEISAESRGHEVSFLLDCSGSMGGTSIAEARRALALCVRALGAEDTFNVVRFGASFTSLWSSPRRFDDRSLAEASAYIEATEADLGGTEILAPLAQLLEAKLDRERARRVLVLTDGQVSNEDEVLALARGHAGSARIFAFGIGAGASEHLVRGMARVSGGAAEMIFPGERIEPKVLRTFGRVRTPVLDDVRIDWKGLRAEMAPARVPPVFAGDALTLFARIEVGTPGAGAPEVELVLAGRRFAVPLDLERVVTGGAVPILWAREAIRELEDRGRARGSDRAAGSQQRRGEKEETRRKRLVELGVRYGLLSSATSFVAVEDRSASQQVDEPAELRRIPVALATGWGGRDQSIRGSASMGPPPAAPIACAPSPARRLRGVMFEAPAHAAMGDVEAEECEEAEARDSLFELLMTQRAEGSFSLSPVLEALLGKARVLRVRAALAAHGEKVVATAVVLRLLETEHADRASEWKPAAGKAKAWLAKQTTRFDAGAVV